MFFRSCWRPAIHNCAKVFQLEGNDRTCRVNVAHITLMLHIGSAFTAIHFLLLVLWLCSKVIVRTLAYIPEDWESRPYRVVSADWMQVGCPNIFFELSTYIDDFELWTLNLMSESTPNPSICHPKLAVIYYILILHITYYILYIIYYILHISLSLSLSLCGPLSRK